MQHPLDERRGKIEFPSLTFLNSSGQFHHEPGRLTIGPVGLLIFTPFEIEVCEGLPDQPQLSGQIDLLCDLRRLFHVVNRQPELTLALGEDCQRTQGGDAVPPAPSKVDLEAPHVLDSAFDLTCFNR